MNPSCRDEEDRLFPRPIGSLKDGSKLPFRLCDLNLQLLGFDTLSAADVVSSVPSNEVRIQEVVLGGQGDDLRGVSVHYIAWYTTRKRATGNAPGEDLVCWDSTYCPGRRALQMGSKSEKFFPGLEETVRGIGKAGKGLGYVGWEKGFGKKGLVGKVPGEAWLVLWVSVEKG